MCALQEVSHSLVSKARTVSHLHLTNDYISLVRTIMISCHCEFLSQKDKRAISASHWALLCSERANQGGRFWIILHQVPEGVMGICEQEHVLRIFKGKFHGAYLRMVLTCWLLKIKTHSAQVSNSICQKILLETHGLSVKDPVIFMRDFQSGVRKVRLFSQHKKSCNFTKYQLSLTTNMLWKHNSSFQTILIEKSSKQD